MAAKMDDIHLVLRLATPKDARTLAVIQVASWQAAYRGIVSDSFLAAFTTELREQSFHDALVAGLKETYVVEQEDEAVGLLTLGACRDDDVDLESTGEIWAIYLVPTYWRKGIGRLVCRQAELMLQSRGFITIVLWVLEENHNARRFYESMGFHHDGASQYLNLGAELRAIRYRKAVAV